MQLRSYSTTRLPNYPTKIYNSMMKTRSQSQLDLAPYAGRWIALVRGHVSGVGDTAREASALSKTARPKEEPLVVFVPESFAEDEMKKRQSGKGTG
jgi:hypothetical protein